MLFRLSLWLAFGIAVGAVFAGCRGSQSEAGDSRLGPGAKPAARSQSEERVDPAQIEAQAHYAAGIVRAIEEEPLLALGEFYEAAMRDPENESLVMEVSRDFQRTGQPEKALALLKRASESPKASSELFARLGAVYFQLNKIDLATNANRRAIQKNPGLLVPYVNLFFIHLQNRQPQDAKAALDEAAKVSPVEPNFLVGLGEMYFKLGVQFADLKESANARALETLERAEKMGIADLELRLRLADGLNALGKLDRASAIYEQVLKAVADAPFVREAVRAKLAEIYLNNNDQKRAAQLWEGIARDNPTDFRAYYYLGSIAASQTNYLHAAECFSKTILLNDTFAPAYSDLVYMQMTLNKIPEAQTTLAAARKKFPRNFDFEFLSGLADTRQKDFTNAVQHFATAEVIAQATATNRLRPDFYFQFGAACERMGDYKQAEKNFEKCLQINPDFDEAQNYLGFMLADRGEQLERAHDLIAKALKSSPENPAYLDSMAWVLFRLKRLNEALDFQLKAIARSDEVDAEIYNHLGDIYAALGQKDKAQEAWRKSLGVEPNEQVKKKLEDDGGT
jgi:tetratricopeptide (TPR) repeat protein